MIPKETKADIIRFCARMDHKGWVANHDGNISVRMSSGGNFAATPTARFKGDLKEEDLIEVDAAGKKVAGQGGAFSEMAVHLRIFKARPDVQAVVHAHPPSATAVGCANQEMVTTAIPEAVVSIGPGVPLVGLALPNSDALWAELDPLLAHYDAAMVAGNGVFTWGKTLEQAYLRMELVEHLAKIFLASLPLGGPKQLPAKDVQALLKKRAEAGLALPADPARPGWFAG
ncbi:MAG: class II aldolase/adducin family protein [Bdellovibrionota bacterium]